MKQSGILQNNLVVLRAEKCWSQTDLANQARVSIDKQSSQLKRITTQFNIFKEKKFLVTKTNTISIIKLIALVFVKREMEIGE